MPPQRAGEWEHRGERSIYESDWVNLSVADVVMPDGTQVDHHVVRMPRPAAGTIATDGAAVLLIHRHRFITDTWGWEIPAGGVDPGESFDRAAIRETLEETGWEPASVRPLCSFHPANGLLDQTFHIFVGHDAVHRGDPIDTNEADRVEWVATDAVHELLLTGAIGDGLSFAAVAYAFASGALRMPSDLR